VRENRLHGSEGGESLERLFSTPIDYMDVMFTSHPCRNDEPFKLAEWCKLFESLGFKVVGTKIGEEEFVSLPRRLLLIKNIRRDSFLLKPIDR